MSQTDNFPNTTVTSPAVGGQAVAFESPEGIFVFSERTRALYVGTEGTVMVIFKEGAEPVPHKAVAGGRLDVRCYGIAGDGTDADDIVGWF